MSSNENPLQPVKARKAILTWYTPGMNIINPMIISGHVRSPYFESIVPDTKREPSIRNTVPPTNSANDRRMAFHGIFWGELCSNCMSTKPSFCAVIRWYWTSSWRELFILLGVFLIILKFQNFQEIPRADPRRSTDCNFTECNTCF